MTIIDTSFHEAAHIVVGCALGMRVRSATAEPSFRANGQRVLGLVSFCNADPEALAIMFAAGVMWERRFGDIDTAWGDLAMLRQMRISASARLRTLETCAWEILRQRLAIHTTVASALRRGPLRHREIQRLAIGEPAADATD